MVPAAKEDLAAMEAPAVPATEAPAVPVMEAPVVPATEVPAVPATEECPDRASTVVKGLVDMVATWDLPSRVSHEIILDMGH